MRIVSLVPSATETLFELGLGDQVAGITRFCRLPEAALKTKPQVGGTKNPKLNRILELRPDVVIMDQDENRKEDAEALLQHGIRLFTTFPHTVHDSIDIIARMGNDFGAKARATEWCDELRERIATHTPLTRSRTLILIWPRPFITINSDTYVHNTASFFGFDSVFAKHAERYPRISATEIEDCAADAVLLPTDPYPFQPKHAAALKQKFGSLPAAKKDRFWICDGTYLTWHGYATLRALREFPPMIEAWRRTE